MLKRETWENKVQHFEANWWGDCANTYGEETKQIAYAKAMGLDPGTWRGGDHWPKWDFGDASVVDIGGGPSSMLLKSSFGFGVVVDPCPYPEWVKERYANHGVVSAREPAEDYLEGYGDQRFDVALCYNVLQHTMDPELICREMRRVAKRVHLFEWVDLAPHPGHPHELHAEELAEWLQGEGTHVWLDEQYRQIGASSKSPVRQHGWGGTFE
jgi:SAM-dependent methyltransferase